VIYFGKIRQWQQESHGGSNPIGCFDGDGTTVLFSEEPRMAEAQAHASAMRFRAGKTGHAPCSNG
jgi:hypothetical protein